MMDEQTFAARGPYKFRQYSSKYRKEMIVPHGTIVPANERIGWFDLEGIKERGRHMDHWFEPTRSLTPSNVFPGRLFTTRMPKGITGRWQQRVGSEFVDKLDGEASLSRTLSDGLTNPELFRVKVDMFKVKHVIVLVENEEMVKHGSGDLDDFYKDCGLMVHHSPIEDYKTAHVPSIKRDICNIVTWLRDGENCLVHCFGGSGRTGMLVVGVLRAMGCARPIHEARKVKTVYLDTKRQAGEIQDLSFSMDEQLPLTYPRLTVLLVATHVHLLCNTHEANIKSCNPEVGANKLCRRKILQTREMGENPTSCGTTSCALQRAWRRIVGSSDRDSLMVVDFVHSLNGAGYSSDKSSSYITVPALKSVLQSFTRDSSGPDCIDHRTFMDLMYLVACEQVNLAGVSRWSMGEEDDDDF